MIDNARTMICWCRMRGIRGASTLFRRRHLGGVERKYELAMNGMKLEMKRNLHVKKKSEKEVLNVEL